jgi:hypothetical protein
MFHYLNIIVDENGMTVDLNIMQDDFYSFNKIPVASYQVKNELP